MVASSTTMVASSTTGKLLNVCLTDSGHGMSICRNLPGAASYAAPLERQLREFIDQARPLYRHRAWLEDEHIRVYVRKAERMIEGKKMTTLDIASVDVSEDHRGKGLFSSFLQKAHQLNPWDATYIENVTDDRFAEYFWKRDWELKDDISRCFYKRKNQGKFRDAWTRARTDALATSTN